VAVNDGIGNPVQDPFPGISAGADSSAPGSSGASASQTSGPVVGSPVVSVPGASSQVPASRPTVTVTAGDTSGMSDDLPAHASQIMPGPAPDYLSTGAGGGRARVDSSGRYPWQQPAGGQ
jgi:cytochrome c1